MKLIGGKNFPDSARQSITTVLKVLGTLPSIDMNIPVEEHAYIAVPDGFNAAGGGNNVQTMLIPAGTRVGNYFAEGIRWNIVDNGKTVAQTVLEAGKYYTLDTSTPGPRDIIVRAVVELTDEASIERTKRDVADIGAYLEYGKAHPRALDGNYRLQNTPLVIKDSRIYWGTENRIQSGKNTLLDGESILYDDETIIIIPDGDTPAPTEVMSHLWYYRFVEGKLEIAMVAEQLLGGMATVYILHIEQNGTAE